MPLQTDLSVSPYFDDFNETKDFAKVLFKPSVSVQTRELNQLQTLLQKQIERFGDNIVERGTIVSGCNFSFYNNYQFVKIKDNLSDGTPSDPGLYVGLFAKNSSNLQAYIVNFADGFEASPPDLKTLYVTYINSGDNANTSRFSPGDVLTLQDSNASIWKVTVNTGGIGFSNSQDTVVFSPALMVETSSGTYANGDYIINPITGANLEILTVDTTQFSNANLLLLYVAPRDADLADSSKSSTAWTIANGDAVTDQTASISATVKGVYGVGALATISTTGTGQISTVTMVDRGSGYSYLPTVRVRSIDNVTGLSGLSLVPQNYAGKATVASGGEAVGSGYAFHVGDGITYQKGYFLRVPQQTIIVDKYANTPNALSVGFLTREDIITSDIDPSLLDNTLGYQNYTAPGADRLRLIPSLTVVNTAAESLDPEFFELVAWNEGFPYKQNQLTAYSKIGDAMASRTFDEAGDFVVDPFQVTTKSPSDANNEGLVYTVAVDPGTAYISGYTTATLSNFYIDAPKGLDTKISNTVVSFNYGNYIRINELGGVFQFSTGDSIDLYDTPKDFLSSVTLIVTANTVPQGTKIGTARIRSLTLENGIPGTDSTVYRLFLFNIQMNAGKNFRDIRSVYYDGTYKGIADVVLETDPTLQVNVAIFHTTANNGLLFSTGVESLKNSNDTIYTYRTIFQTTATGNNGILTKSIASNPAEVYPYTGTLSDAEMKELLVVPIGNNLIQYANLTGTANISSSNTWILGSGTNFFSDFKPGDFIYIDGSGLDVDTKRVVSITNSTCLVTDSVGAFTNTAAKFYRIFPRNVPVPFGFRDGLTANVDVNRTLLTLRFAHSNGDTITFAPSTTTNTAVGVNIQRTGVSSTAKTVQRDQFVKLRIANNVGGTSGPWCLGVPDVIRLKKVFLGSSSSVSNSDIDVTPDFYIDHNQNVDFLDLSWLSLVPRSTLTVQSGDWFLVQFDYCTYSGAGYFDTVSYLNSSNGEQIAALDSLPLANLTTSACSWEIPEVYTANGSFLYLINQLDFRPSVALSATPASVSGSAPVNPEDTISFGDTSNPANDKKFPLPDSLCSTTIEHYLGRVDNVYIAGGTDGGHIYVMKGIPSADPLKRFPPNLPKDSLKLQTISVPPYPNLEDFPSLLFQQILDTKVYGQKASDKYTLRLIDPILRNIEMQKLAQPKGYTMSDIGNLDRRIRDLEYYTSLSILETSITNKIIPSSIDGTLNRFKFGFVADDFSSQTYQDINNPQYAATIEAVGFQDYSSQVPGFASVANTPTNLLVPPEYIWMVGHVVRNLDYTDFRCLSQNNASVPGPPPTPGGNTTIIIIHEYPPPPLVYHGSITFQFVGTTNINYVVSDVYVCTATGLKPNTLHNIQVLGAVNPFFIFPGYGGLSYVSGGVLTRPSYTVTATGSDYQHFLMTSPGTTEIGYLLPSTYASHTDTWTITSDSRGVVVFTMYTDEWNYSTTATVGRGSAFGGTQQTSTIGTISQFMLVRLMDNAYDSTAEGYLVTTPPLSYTRHYSYGAGSIRPAPGMF